MHRLSDGMTRSIGRLTGSLVRWWVGWLVGWLAGRPADLEKKNLTIGFLKARTTEKKFDDRIFKGPNHRYQFPIPT